MTRLPKISPMLVALAAALGGPVMAQLSPPAQRITDEAIQADHQTYERLQARLKALNDGGRPVRDYGLAKAQCWLDVSFHEYTRNDRSAFPDLALGQAGVLAAAMEQGRPLGWDTPLVNDAERLRPDLWARAEALRSHAGWRCAQHKAACAEVELVHAGNEQRQLQWRHAKPYVQIAEDLTAEAELLAQRCEPPPAPPVVVLPPPPPPAPLPVVKTTVQLMASVVFNFDRHTVADMRSFSVEQLKTLAAQLRSQGLVVRRLQLAGHADRLNGTGQGDYNQRLSEKRAATVRAALAELGVTAADVQVSALGDGQPVTPCSGRFASTVQLEECLLPNRRVDVLVIAEPR
jgi:outer membrane protein OmpA-like peptidoglycan-associated protein